MKNIVKYCLLAFNLMILIMSILFFINTLDSYKMQKEYEVLLNNADYNEHLRNDIYWYQNQYFCLDTNKDDQLENYLPANRMDETKLYIRLYVYNQNSMNTDELTISDIKDYLSCELYDDGSLRAENYPKEIKDYIEFCMSGYPIDKEIDEFKNELEDVRNDLIIDHPEIDIPQLSDMTTMQVQELINKVENSDYEVILSCF